MDIQAHQAGRRSRRLTGVDAHPHPDVFPGGPGMGLDGPLLYTAAAAHARGEENTAKNASPWVSTSSPS